MEDPVPIRVQSRDTGVQITLAGAIDFTNAHTVSQTLVAAVSAQHPAKIQLDLSEATFFDSSGIGVLVMAKRLADRTGADYAITGPTTEVYEHLRIVGLAQLWNVPGPGDATRRAAQGRH